MSSPAGRTLYFSFARSDALEIDLLSRSCPSSCRRLGCLLLLHANPMHAREPKANHHWSDTRDLSLTSPPSLPALLALCFLRFFCPFLSPSALQVFFLSQGESAERETRALQARERKRVIAEDLRPRKLVVFLVACWIVPLSVYVACERWLGISSSLRERASDPEAGGSEGFCAATNLLQDSGDKQRLQQRLLRPSRRGILSLTLLYRGRVLSLFFQREEGGGQGRIFLGSVVSGVWREACIAFENRAT